MMFGRFYGGRGFHGVLENNGCFNYGYMHSGWSFFIVAGIIIIITLLIFLFVHNRKKEVVTKSTMETLKMKYAMGEITEEEYIKRKEVLSKK